jgi:hypothetical protein
MKLPFSSSSGGSNGERPYAKLLAIRSKILSFTIIAIKGSRFQLFFEAAGGSVVIILTSAKRARYACLPMLAEQRCGGAWLNNRASIRHW